MAWRVARSLIELRDQVNAAFPRRSKASDGTIGDAAHAASVSDHNPDAAGIVRALDLTHDPAHGFDAAALAEQLRCARDPRIKYVISNRRIFSATVSPWTWRTYTGSDPHTSHVHVSVVATSRADSTAPWTVPMLTNQEEDMSAEDVKAVNGYTGALLVYGYDSGGKRRPSVVQQLASLSTQVAGLSAAVRALAQSKPGVDPDAVVKAVQASVDKALADVSITLTNPN
jgi:hypothetical protein